MGVNFGGRHDGHDGSANKEYSLTRFGHNILTFNARKFSGKVTLTTPLFEKFLRNKRNK